MIKNFEELEKVSCDCSACLAAKFSGEDSKRHIVLCGGTGCLSSNSAEILAEFQKQIKERDFIQRYAISLSNNKFDIWGFVPTLTFSYTKRDSNVKTREYDKMTVEFTMQQRF